MRTRRLRTTITFATALRFLLGAVLSARALGCGTDQAPAPKIEERRGQLSEGVAARVSDEEVLVSSVRRVAEEQRIPLQEARARLVSDALLAAGAKERGYESHTGVQAAWRSSLARELLERLREDRYADPITDQELARFTAAHWLDMDRPVARSSAHVLVQLADANDAKERNRALELAQQLARVLRGITDAEAFVSRAKEVPTEGFKVVAQLLPPITDDARHADLKNRPPPGVETPTFDKGFVRALFEIERIGEQSEPVFSAFGPHVILLTGIQPEVRVPVEERREKLAPEIRAARGREAADALVASLRAQTPVVVERNAESILQVIPAAREDEGR